MEKLLDLMTLEPVDSFEVCFRRRVSGLTQILFRLIAVVLAVFVLTRMHGTGNPVRTVLHLSVALMVAELVWNGYREYAYLADFIIHEATVWMFIYVTATAENPLWGLAGVALAHMLSPLERRALHETKYIDHSVVDDWARYYERSTKMKYWCLVMMYAILTNFTTLVL